MCSSTSTAVCNYVVNGLYVPCAANVAVPAVGSLVINAGVSSAEATAGWQVAEVLIWNRQLSVAELMGVTQYWKYTYALDWFTGSCAAPAHRFLPSAVPGVTSGTASPVPDTGSAAAWSGLVAYGGVAYDATGGALLFNGAADSYASFGNLSLGGDSLTTVLWVRYDSFQGGSERVYELAKGISGGLYQAVPASLAIGTYPAGYIRATATAGTSSASCQAPTVLAAGTWAHVAVVFSGLTSTVTMYINGAFACRVSTPGVVSVPLSATMPAAFAALGKSSYLSDKVRSALRHATAV